jgi:hypothetical protein
VRRSDAHVADERKLQTSTKRDAVDGCDDGLWASIEHAKLGSVKTNLPTHVVRAHALALFEIGACTKRFVAYARNHDGTDRNVIDKLAAEPAEREQGLTRQGVSTIGAVDQEQAHAASAL